MEGLKLQGHVLDLPVNCLLGKTHLVPCCHCVGSWEYARACLQHDSARQSQILSLLAFTQAHSLAVYGVKWNCIHHKTFLSASADWLVKLWDSNQPKKPILTFDFSDAVRACCRVPSLLLLHVLDALTSCSHSYNEPGHTFLTLKHTHITTLCRWATLPGHPTPLPCSQL